MNASIRNLKKDKSIIKLLQHLTSKFGADKFLIVDHWEGDLCAIGITDLKEHHLVYLSTWHRQDQYYFVSIEEIATDSGDGIPHSIKREYEDVRLNQLEQLIKPYIT